LFGVLRDELPVEREKYSRIVISNFTARPLADATTSSSAGVEPAR